MTSEIVNTDFEVVNLSEWQHPRIKIQPIYYQLGLSNVATVYGRRAVFDRVLLALSHLPDEYGFLIYDVYRPRLVQAQIFAWMQNEIKKNYPHLSEQEVYIETKKYAALPPKVGEDYCSPHLSGGAIDLTLFDLHSQQVLDMGSDFDECSERSHRDYFDNRAISALTQAEKNSQQKRKLLRMAMELSGFTSYPYEWWHYDIGTLFWEQSTGKKAIFGPLFGNREWPSEI